MKQTFRVVIYQETYSEYEVEAETQEEANDLAWSGECGDPIDVTVKNSEIID